MAVTFNTQGGVGPLRLLESFTITNNQIATLAIAKAVTVPPWATYATWYLNIAAMTGTSPLVDFKLEAVDPIGLTAVAPLGSWDGITQKTTNTTVCMTTVDVGPGLTVDDSGSATASDNYKVDAPLPGIILYTITLDGTTGDEDYTITLAAAFKK